MRNTFTFGSILSSDYGVYISGTGVFNAPERDVTTVEIPGRDGVLTLDNGRFREIAHTYPAFVVPPFKDNIRGLRNALLSKRGLVRLSDTYHSDEYYLAYYEKGLEVEPTVTLKEGELEIEFTRDPRRFLLTGDTPVELGAWGQTSIASGNPAWFTAGNSVAIRDAETPLPLNQAGSGDPSPSNVRKITGYKDIKIFYGTAPQQSAAASKKISLGRTVYIGGLNVTQGILTITHEAITIDGASVTVTEWGSNDVFIYPMGATMAKKADWSTGIYCDKLPTVATAQALRTSKYGVSGAATSASQAYIYIGNNESTTADEMNAWLQEHPLTVVYELATPQTYGIVQTQIPAERNATNYIWSSTHDISIEYGASPNDITNPTLYPARPVIRVYGAGTLTVGETLVTVAQNPYEYIDIDSEMMDCYHGDDNANSYVSFSDGEFPTLTAGINSLGYDGGITRVIVTPHWWRL